MGHFEAEKETGKEEEIAGKGKERKGTDQNPPRNKFLVVAFSGVRKEVAGLRKRFHNTRHFVRSIEREKAFSK